MFFARFDAENETGEDVVKQRLEALKQKIANQHPEKRRKISSSEKKIETQEKLDIKDEEGCKEIIPAREKKKKKKKKTYNCEEYKETHGTGSVDNEPRKTNGTEKSKISKQIEETVNQDETTNLEKKKKKKKKKKIDQESSKHTSVNGECETSVKNDDQKENPLNNAEQLNKSSKKVEPTLEPDVQPEPQPTEQPTEESTEQPTEESTEQPTEESTEEWTILGKHKTTEKVGHVKRALPDWIVECNVIDPDFGNTTPLEEFELLDDQIVAVLKDMGISSLFPIQSQIVPDILDGCQGVGMLKRNFTPPRDICVSAPTGSGKTLVYVLSLVQCLYRLPPMLQAIVVVPTKNLANQVKQVFNNFAKLIKVVLLSGRDTFPAEQKHLYNEQGLCLAHVVVSTPGRLVNHIRETKLFTLQHLRFLVIDEMDTLLNQTYQDWLPSLFDTVYNTKPFGHPLQPIFETHRFESATNLSLAQLTKLALPLQKLLFSATVTHDPSKLAPLQLYNPSLYSCGGKYNLPASLKQYQIRCKLEDKALVLIHLVQTLKHVLCFTSSVDTAHRLALLTEEYGGVSVAEYSSTLTPPQRNKVVRQFSSGQLQLLVCSDSLARGMDISLVDHVVNYDVPAHVQTYVHRVGRTARAGKIGSAYTLVRYEETRHFHQLLKKAGDTRAADFNISDSVIESLSASYQECLDRLVLRLKTSKKSK